MDVLTAILAQPATGYISTGAILSFLILQIIRGKLRPGSEVDYWREAYFKGEETKKVLVEQNASLLNFAPIMERAFAIAFPVTGRTLNGGQHDEDEKVGS